MGLGQNGSAWRKILAVADHYDALICVHPHSEPLPPHLALARLRCLGSAAFDRDVLEHVIRCLGAYPVGSVVETDGGRRAVVVGKQPGYAPAARGQAVAFLLGEGRRAGCFSRSKG